MEIIPIFEINDQTLFALKYKNETNDEFDRLFELWQDVQYLEEFFDNNKTDLTYFGKSVEEAVKQTRADAKELQKQFLDIRSGQNNKKLDSYFHTLDRYKPTSSDEYERCKSYGTFEKSWIRLYTIKIPDNSFIITGGAIKLTKAMSERPHTQKEIDNLNNCMFFLHREGIIDKKGLKD